MNKEVWLLAVLVGVAVCLNSIFIITIQMNSYDDEEKSLANSVGNVIGGTDIISPLFSKKTLDTYTKKTTTVSKRVKPVPVTPIASENIKIIKGENGFEMVVNYDQKTFTINNREYPFSIDSPEVFRDTSKLNINMDEEISKFNSASGWTGPLSGYERFDLYVDTDLYYSNQINLDLFFNQFEERFEMLEQQTNWNSEKVTGNNKLQVYIHSTSACSSGWAFLGEAHIYLSNPFPKETCKQPYYENGQLFYGNQGELGDYWVYMLDSLHETQHSINAINRPWINEGFSEYLGYNIMKDYGDINKETADTYIYNGFTGYQWSLYAANNYRDTTINNLEIQESLGYDITAWMFSMMRDNHSMDWNEFYNIFNNNLETLDEADSMYPVLYFRDMVVINIFGKSVGYNFSQTKDIWEYDGPSGPGWGVRNWESIDWYADLRPSSNGQLVQGPNGYKTYSMGSQNIPIIIYNDGNVTLNNVSVRAYLNDVLVDENFIKVNERSYNTTTISFTQNVEGIYGLRIVVNEDEIKLETNYDNNEITASLGFFYPPVIKEITTLNINEMKKITITPTATYYNPSYLTYSIDSNLFTKEGNSFSWTPGPEASGVYTFTITASDSPLSDTETFTLNVLDSCTEFLKPEGIWNCESPSTGINTNIGVN